MTLEQVDAKIENRIGFHLAQVIDLMTVCRKSKLATARRRRSEVKVGELKTASEAASVVPLDVRDATRIVRKSERGGDAMLSTIMICGLKIK